MPKRNCDIYKTESEAKVAFIAYARERDEYDWELCELKHNVDGILIDFVKWLFEPADIK